LCDVDLNCFVFPWIWYQVEFIQGDFLSSPNPQRIGLLIRGFWILVPGPVEENWGTQALRLLPSLFRNQRGLPSPLIFRILEDTKAQFVPFHNQCFGVRIASMVRMTLSCLGGLNSD